jgi:hypothetical protein
MALFRRNPPAPAAAKKLAGSERVLAWAVTATDAVLVATPVGLWWPSAAVDEDTAGEPELLPWWRIDKAVWRDEVLTITAADADDLLLVERRPMAQRLSDPGNLPAVIRKRIEGSIRKTERVSLPSGEVRVVARTVAGKDGLTWLARLEGGTVDTPELRGELSQLIVQLTQQSDAALKM